MLKKSAALFFAVVLFAPAVFGSGGLEEEPGNAVSSDYPVSGFDRVDLSVYGNVAIHYSPDYRVTITAAPEIHERLKITVRDGKLNIGSRWRPFPFFQRFKRITVEIYTPRLEGAFVSGSGNIELLDKFTSPSFTADISGSGKITGAVDSGELSAGISGSGTMIFSGIQQKTKLDISGSGDVVMTGAADDVSVEISGSGGFDGSEFKSASVAVRISGSGDARVWAEDSLRARVSGSGNVSYRGNPAIDFSGSGSGRIRSEG
jgi:hypothetical protein